MRSTYRPLYPAVCVVRTARHFVEWGLFGWQCCIIRVSLAVWLCGVWGGCVPVPEYPGSWRWSGMVSIGKNPKKPPGGWGGQVPPHPKAGRKTPHPTLPILYPHFVRMIYRHARTLNPTRLPSWFKSLWQRVGFAFVLEWGVTKVLSSTSTITGFYPVVNSEIMEVKGGIDHV